MGLFDKKKKEKNIEENTAENIKVEDSDVTESVSNGRRFYVIIDGVTTMLDGNGSIITGQLFGSIKKGDRVYVCQAGEAFHECEVQAIEASEGERSSIVEEAADTKVSLQLSLSDDVKLRKYAVITNIKPQDKIDPKVSIENPALAGLVNGISVYGKDNAYHGTLAYHASHAHFITPIKVEKEPEVNEKGIAVITKDTKIGFYMLKSQVKLTGTAEDQDSMVLPLFTDWESLRRWEGLSKDGQRIHTQILSFQDVYGMLKRGNVYAGIAINPFNKVPCTLPITYLDTITGTPGYQKDFPTKDGGANVHEEKIPAGKRILLGVPKESEETTSIRQALLEYGRSHEDILSIAFLTKVEEDTKIVRHLVVLEFPEGFETDNMKVHMEAIYQALKPLAKEITQVEYAIKGRVKAIDDVVAAHALQMVVYNK